MARSSLPLSLCLLTLSVVGALKLRSFSEPAETPDIREILEWEILGHILRQINRDNIDEITAAIDTPEMTKFLQDFGVSKELLSALLHMYYSRLDASGDGKASPEEVTSFMKQVWPMVKDMMSEEGFSSLESEVLGQIDTNDNGRYNLQEITAAFNRLPPTFTKLLQDSGVPTDLIVPLLPMAFSMLDASDDGEASPEELISFMRVALPMVTTMMDSPEQLLNPSSMFPGTPEIGNTASRILESEVLGQMLRQIDANDNGRYNLEEITGALDRLPPEMTKLLQDVGVSKELISSMLPMAFSMLDASGDGEASLEELTSFMKQVLPMVMPMVKDTVGNLEE